MFRRVMHAVLPAVTAALVLSAAARATTPQETTRDSAFQYKSHGTTEGIQEISVTFQSGGTDMPGVIFQGQSAKPQPGLVYLHDGSQGVDDDVRLRCRELAGLGLVVFAPDYRGAKGTTGESPAQIDMVLDAGKAMTTLRSVEGERLGLMGTSQGGYLALRAAAEGKGMWRCVVQGSGSIDVAKTVTNLRTKVLLQHGWKDDTVALKYANHLDASLRKAGNSCELKEYTMLPHNLWYWENRGFNGDELSQAQWAWEDCTQFLSRTLQPSGAGMSAR